MTQAEDETKSQGYSQGGIFSADISRANALKKYDAQPGEALWKDEAVGLGLSKAHFFNLVPDLQRFVMLTIILMNTDNGIDSFQSCSVILATSVHPNKFFN